MFLCKMIDRQVYSDRLRVTDATELSVKDAVVGRDSMSQSMPTLLPHTQKCVHFLHQNSSYFKGVV